MAIDGSTTAEVPAQAERIPADTTQLVLSVGGNDALMKSDILQMPARSTSEVLATFAGVAGNFENSYRSAVNACKRHGLPLAFVHYLQWLLS